LLTHDAKLFAGIIDNSQLRCLNATVQAGKFSDRAISLRLYIYNVVILTEEVTEVNAKRSLKWISYFGTAELQSFGDMCWLNTFGTCQICDSARDFDSAHVAAGRNTELFGGSVQDGFSGW
jgi:hypothetical protein